jgi:putative acetyltransferase
MSQGQFAADNRAITDASTSTPANAPVQLHVRRARIADAADCMRIHGDADVYPQTLQLPYPDEELWRKRLTDTLAPGQRDLLLVGEISLDGGPYKVQGLAGLHSAGHQLRRQHVMSLGICIHPDGQGLGLGWVLLTALLDYADRWSQVLRVELEVYADNARAIRLFESLGFETEGRLRGASLRDGVYVDTLCMARWHPNPPSRVGVAASVQHGLHPGA